MTHDTPAGGNQRVPDNFSESCSSTGSNQTWRLAFFGSVLREDFGPESDIDVLVEFEPEAEVGFLALSRMQRELSDLLQRPVDLVPQAGLKPRIRDTVLASAEELYAA